MARRISSNVGKMLSDQANRELSASRMYLSMSLWFGFHSYEGSAAWCRKHSEEERVHALKIFDHLAEREMEDILRLDKNLVEDWDLKKDMSPLDVWRVAQKQEVSNSECILNCFKAAREGNDYITEKFLHWFLEEQLEEESALETICDHTERALKTGGLYSDLDFKLPQFKH